MTLLNAINRFGLSRSIPSDIKRKIRQNSGFGCVICGCGIFDYEHVDPLWIDAESHDAENMTLLCPTCHAKKTRGMMSIQTIHSAMNDPKTKQNGYSSDIFDFHDKHPFIEFGGVRLENCPVPIQVNGAPLFQIDSPEEPGTPFRLSAEFYDSFGQKSLFILKNEWRAFNTNWDVEVKGPTITIREKAGKLNLTLTAVPPEGIIIERLQMNYQEWKFLGGKDYLTVNGMTFTDCLVSNCSVGMAFGY